MRLLSWNCQGLGSTLTGKALTRLCHSHHPEILFLMETRQPEATIRSWLRRLKFTHYHVVNHLRTRGGLALLWHDSVTVTIIDSSPNFVDTVVCFPYEDLVCNITWMYGMPHENRKTAFWLSMYHRFQPKSQPWLLMGDFNEITDPSEKWGGAPPDNWRLKLFNGFINQAHLRDLNFQGPAFTWFCIRNGWIFLKERLDRALGNASWFVSNPNTQVCHLPKIGSDHRPIILDTHPNSARTRP